MSNFNYADQADIFDSRDVIERISELEADAVDLDGELYIRDADEREEYAILKKFAEEAENSAADWPYGETFIRDSYFTQFAIEYAADVSSEVDAVKSDSWPFCHIDWDAAADSLRQDYTSYELDGVTYWAR